MEKISGIIPATHRVVSVDLSEARPLRPGVPSFGQPVGVSSKESRRKEIAVNSFVAGAKNTVNAKNNNLKEILSDIKLKSSNVEDRLSLSPKAINEYKKSVAKQEPEKTNQMKASLLPNVESNGAQTELKKNINVSV